MNNLFFIETSLRDAVSVSNLINDMYRDGVDFEQHASNYYRFYDQTDWEDFTTVCENLKLEVWATIENKNGLILN